MKSTTTLYSLCPQQDMRGDVHSPRLQSRQTVRQAKAPGWISWGPFPRLLYVGLRNDGQVSSISFGQAKEMDSGLG